jgi:hypothetical protein
MTYSVSAGDDETNQGSVFCDEKGKILLRRRACSHMVTGSGFGGSSVPQNLGLGQRMESNPTTSRVRGLLQKGGKELT